MAATANQLIPTTATHTTTSSFQSFYCYLHSPCRRSQSGLSGFISTTSNLRRPSDALAPGPTYPSCSSLSERSSAFNLCRLQLCLLSSPQRRMSVDQVLLLFFCTFPFIPAHTSHLMLEMFDRCCSGLLTLSANPAPFHISLPSDSLIQLRCSQHSAHIHCRKKKIHNTLFFKVDLRLNTSCFKTYPGLKRFNPLSSS